MPDQPQSQFSVCGFYTIYAVFRFFKFQQERITRFHDVSVFSIRE